jgi:hypothetical protein
MQRTMIEISDADLEQVSGGDDKAAAPAQTKPAEQKPPKLPPLPKPPANDGFNIAVGIKAEAKTDKDGQSSGYIGIYVRGTF